MLLNTFIQKGLFLFLTAIIIEGESQLNQLLKTIFHIHVNGLLVSQCRSIIKPERFTRKRVKVIRNSSQFFLFIIISPFCLLLNV